MNTPISGPCDASRHRVAALEKSTVFILDRPGMLLDQNDHEGWVFKGIFVLQRLIVSFIQVGLFALVLSGKMMAISDVGPAFAACGFDRASLEGNALSGWVHLRGGGVAD